MKSLSDKDEIMNRLSNRLQYLACDVGERERKLNSAKAKYLSESREYQNTQKRRASRNRNPFMMAGRHYQTPHYNPLALWPGTRGGYPRGASHAHSYGSPRRHPRSMGVTPWNAPPPPLNWNNQIPNRKPRRRRNVPEGEWAVCWNFNSTRGCPRGTRCPWRHQKYSTAGNETTGESRDEGTRGALTNVGQSRREVVKVQPRSHPEGVTEIENKKQDDGATEVVRQETNPSKSPPVQWSPNVKARDIDTDSKEEQETPTRVKYGYNGGEPPESETDESGVE